MKRRWKLVENNKNKKIRKDKKKEKEKKKKKIGENKMIKWWKEDENKMKIKWR